MTFQDHRHCPHQWTQKSHFIPAWVRDMPSPKVCPQPNPPFTPNPAFPNTATQQICTPLELKKTGPCTVLLTVSIPAESIITLPTRALEIINIRKSLQLTQSRFFNCVPSGSGIPQDTPKLFLRGLVRKDIQYSEAVRQTATTVEGVMKDFVVDIPISCTIDLGGHLIFPPVHYDQERIYGFTRSSDLKEYNVLSRQFYNPLPTCQLLLSQINEGDDALDRIPLQGGPLSEGTFTILQEKMIIMIQVRLTFPSRINYLDDHHKDHKYDKDCKHCKHKHDKDCKHSKHHKRGKHCKHHKDKKG